MSKQKKELKRNKLGQFMPVELKAKVRPHFNQRYIKKEVLEDSLYDAYTDGFEAGRKLKATVSAKASYQTWLENNK